MDRSTRAPLRHTSCGTVLLNSFRGHSAKAVRSAAEGHIPEVPFRGTRRRPC